MRFLRAAIARIVGSFTGHRANDELRDELQSHLEMQMAENIRRGMQPDDDAYWLWRVRVKRSSRGIVRMSARELV